MCNLTKEVATLKSFVVNEDYTLLLSNYKDASSSKEGGIILNPYEARPYKIK